MIENKDRGVLLNIDQVFDLKNYNLGSLIAVDGRSQIGHANYRNNLFFILTFVDARH